MFSIIPHGVEVVACFSHARHVIGCRLSKITGKTLHEKVVVSLFARANTAILPGTDPEWNTTNTQNDSEMKKEVEERKLHGLAMVLDCWEM
jgi:hypothetical protein